MMTHIPRSGPLRLDGRSVSPALAVERIRTLVRRLRRPHPRQIEMQIDRPAVLSAVAAWAASHDAPWGLDGDVIQIFLMSARFDEAPAATLRELDALRPAWDEITETDDPPLRAGASA
ncbi:MAG: hypothetical protein AAGA48_36610 [Myxococcota bacterium]